MCATDDGHRTNLELGRDDRRGESAVRASQCAPGHARCTRGARRDTAVPASTRTAIRGGTGQTAATFYKNRCDTCAMGEERGWKAHGGWLGEDEDAGNEEEDGAVVDPRRADGGEGERRP